MAGTPSLTDSVLRRRAESPRTVLAFFGTVVGLFLSAAIGLIFACAYAGMGSLIPWILAAVGGSCVLVVGGIFVVMLRDPAKLMLGQITGEEYAQIRRITHGDSRLGEWVTVESPGAGPIAALPVAVPDNSASTESEEEEE